MPTKAIQNFVGIPVRAREKEKEVGERGADQGQAAEDEGRPRGRGRWSGATLLRQGRQLQVRGGRSRRAGWSLREMCSCLSSMPGRSGTLPPRSEKFCATPRAEGAHRPGRHPAAARSGPTGSTWSSSPDATPRRTSAATKAPWKMSPAPRCRRRRPQVCRPHLEPTPAIEHRGLARVIAA